MVLLRKYQYTVTLLLIILLMQLANPVVAIVDSDPPVLHWAQFDRSLAFVNEEVTIIVNASDVLSGINNGFASVYGSHHNVLIAIPLTYNVNTKLLEGSFLVNLYWPSSLYVGFIDLYDNANNPAYLGNGTDFISPVIDLVGTKDDSTPPIMNYVEFDRHSAFPDETVGITMNATDDIAGIDFGNVYIFNTATSIKVTETQLTFSVFSDLLEGSIVINSNWPTSLYIGLIHIYDRANNRNELFNGTDFTSPILNLNGTTFDDTPPLVHSVLFDRTEAIVNYEVGIIINAIDDISGVQDGWAHIHDVNGSPLTSIKLLPNTNTGLLEGTFIANEFWAYPVSILRATVGDNAGNTIEYRNSTDFTAPVLIKSNYTFPPGIYLSVTPFGGSSIVNDIVQFEIEVNSTFIHDMSNVTLVLEGVHDSGLFKYGDSYSLPANGRITIIMKVNFTLVGHYDLTAILYDDLNIPWSYNFGWDVKDKEIIPDPEVSDPLTNSTEHTIPATAPTSDDAPVLNLPGFSIIGVFGSFAVLFLLVSHKRRL